jgi:hypothetical protein
MTTVDFMIRVGYVIALIFALAAIAAGVASLITGRKSRTKD